VKTTTALTTLHELAELPQIPIATCPVDRGNQILLITQSPGEAASELPLYAKTRFGHLRKNSRTFNRLNFLFFL
jgi:hypothetical protein